jgi:hypothetical protein
LRGAVAGDYAESPAEPQLLLAQRLDYLVVPVLPLVLPPMPLLPLAPLLELPGRGAGCAGVVGLVVEPPMVEPLVEPEAPEPALARFSRTHLSCSAPVRPRHFEGIAPGPEMLPPAPAAPWLPAPLPEPCAPTPLSPLPPPTPPALSPVLLLVLPGAPLAPLEPEAPDDAPPEPAPPDPEPEPWAKVAVESARSAAAVAAVMVFNIMSDLLEMDGLDCCPQHARAVPVSRVHSANAL